MVGDKVMAKGGFWEDFRQELMGAKKKSTQSEIIARKKMSFLEYTGNVYKDVFTGTPRGKELLGSLPIGGTKIILPGRGHDPVDDVLRLRDLERQIRTLYGEARLREAAGTLKGSDIAKGNEMIELINQLRRRTDPYLAHVRRIVNQYNSQEIDRTVQELIGRQSGPNKLA